MSGYKPSTDLSIFQFRTQHVRVFTDAAGMHWWVAEDLAAILGIVQPSSTIRAFPLTEKGLHTVQTLGGVQQLLMVNESGLYRLIFRSRKPEAEAFQYWIFHEMLPTLRRTGTYTMPGAVPPPPPRHHVDAPREFTVSHILCFWEVYTHQHTWYTTETLAQAAQISVRRVRDYCRYFADLGLFERVRWHPLKQYRWREDAPTQAPALVQAYVRAYGMLPKDLPERGAYPWEREDDPHKW